MILRKWKILHSLSISSNSYKNINQLKWGSNKHPITN